MASRRFSVELEWTSTAPFVARRLVEVWLDGVGCGTPARDDAVLVVSELVSAAVNERIGVPVLDVELHHGTLRVRVTNGTWLDDDVVPTADDDLCARVLDASCDDWGCETCVDGTRQWASLDLAGRARRDR